MRKLASIRVIDEIVPIEGADAIECAVVGGWRVVVKKGEFVPGDLAVYFEIDSFIPHELAPFLSKGQEPREYNGVKGERLRTVKLRGQVSQGLLLPVNIIQTKSLPAPGTDVADLLGIQKYEPPVPASLAGQVKGAFPSCVPKTDEERIQNLTNEWTSLSTLTYEVTEKLEGSSMTVGMVASEFIVCSRNLNLRESEGNTLWAVARKNDIEAKMLAHGLNNLVFQGELIGSGVQGNHYGIQGQDFYVFSVYDIAMGAYLNPVDRMALVDKLGLKHVPVIHESLTLDGMTVEAVLNLADGPSRLNTAKLREGLVFKAQSGQEHWKAVSNQYLLKAE